ncbi:hypothetical protein [Nocardia fusca]|uniref:Uncharacterized protein n=1 Tax=Nocardia fusca TaxID=941183 RepID=A0ABV3FKI1_9NOCA
MPSNLDRVVRLGRSDVTALIAAEAVKGTWQSSPIDGSEIRHHPDEHAAALNEGGRPAATGDLADLGAYQRRLDAFATAERAARALRSGPVYRERAEIASEVGRAATAAQAVGMPLGMWCANGDYAKFPEEARTRAGDRALAELDAVLADLAAGRERLAAAISDDAGPTEPTD